MRKICITYNIYITYTFSLKYNRKLWDPDCEPELPDNGIKEWHSHVYGNGKIGIFLFDLRGNRITPDGEQMSDNSLLSEEQWQDFQVGQLFKS